jgi:hypothetical protein
MTPQKEAIDTLIAEVLDGTELRLTVDKYALEETFESGEVKLRCDVHNRRTGERHTIDARGVGLVAAFYSGLIAQYAGAFPSLNTIRFADFTVRAKLETGREAAKTDSTAEVTLRVANSEGQEVLFAHTSPSITRSSIEVVLQSVEFFINSERAFIAVYRALQQARRDNRPDSIQRYTQQLSTLVQATSYSDVIDQIRASELNKA